MFTVAAYTMTAKHAAFGATVVVRAASSQSSQSQSSQSGDAPGLAVGDSGSLV